MTTPTPVLASLPATIPFVGPEHLARQAGLPACQLLRLGANESTFGPAPGVVAALREGTDSVSFYGDPELWELRTLIAELYATDRERVIVAGGIDELLGLFTRAFMQSGDVALMTAGSYPTFAYHVRGYGGVLQTVDYVEGRVDLDALAVRAERVRPALIYLANPDNPSGSLCDPAQLAAFLTRVPAQSLVLLDEAYAEYAGAALPASVPSNVVRLRTFSKAYGLAGLRVGYAFCEPAVAAVIEKIRLHFGVGSLAQRAAIAALQRPAYVASVVSETERGRHDYAQMAREFGLTTYSSSTNFVLFELTAVARAEALVKALLAERVFVRKPMLGSIASCIRVTVGTAHERQRFRTALASALAQIPREAPE